MTERCKTCGGKGVVYDHYDPRVDGFGGWVKYHCPDCEGTGERETSDGD